MNQYQNYKAYQNYATPVLLPQKPPKARKHTGVVAFSVVLVVVFASIAQIALTHVAETRYPALLENQWFLWGLSSLPLYLVGMPIGYLLLLTIPKSAPQKRKLHPLMWIGFLFLSFALTFITNFIGQYINAWITGLVGGEVKNEVEEMTSIAPFVVNLVFVGILAPIFEELFFRKAIIDRLRRYGDLPAVLLSGLIFGLIHGNFSQIFYATVVGMLLSFIYVRTGSVLYTISIHAVFNMIGGVYTTELVRRVGEDLTAAEGDTVGAVMVLAYIAFVLLSLVVGLIFLLVNLRRFNRSLKKGEYTLSFDQWMKALLINPGMWAFFALIGFSLVASLFV